jgi:hypothetical protein
MKTLEEIEVIVQEAIHCRSLSGLAGKAMLELLLHVQEQARVISCMQNSLLQLEEDILRHNGDIK